jgi:hypothetical protein
MRKSGESVLKRFATAHPHLAEPCETCAAVAKTRHVENRYGEATETSGPPLETNLDQLLWFDRNVMLGCPRCGRFYHHAWERDWDMLSEWFYEDLTPVTLERAIEIVEAATREGAHVRSHE